ncbi:MAG TPA: selenium cofactor biosynthesis protein YqeC [Gammaproteobacteria bacterium]|nr:selenium cofactor biosynthesis protein YqeC [Gammaproteobacteria bacterium]
MAAASLREQLGLGKGVIVAAGAGGKKTVLYALAGQFPGRVGITTTVNCPLPPTNWRGEVIVAPEPELTDRLHDRSGTGAEVFFAAPGKREELVGGISPTFVATLRSEAVFDVLLVKADGARRRLIKAPGEGEPNYPPGTDIVLYLVSAHAFGRTLESGIAHRIDELAAVTGLRRDTAIEPEHVARLLSSESGALKNLARGTRIVPVINRADTPLRRRLAVEAARLALKRTDRFDTVLVGCMGENPPVFEAVTRL